MLKVDVMIRRTTNLVFSRMNEKELDRLDNLGQNLKH
jgi:hypothetical protein